MDVLLDSNIVIYAVHPLANDLRNWIENQNVYISKVTRLEVLGYHKIDSFERNALSRIMDSGIYTDIEDAVIDRAIGFRQEKSMSLGDSIIAGTATLMNITLATANTKDFAHIEHLDVINPLEL